MSEVERDVQENEVEQVEAEIVETETEVEVVLMVILKASVM